VWKQQANGYRTACREGVELGGGIGRNRVAVESSL
jgi:hypothetical protein